MDSIPSQPDRRPAVVVARAADRAADRAAVEAVLAADTAAVARRASTAAALSAAVDAVARAWVETGRWTIGRSATASQPGGTPEALGQAATRAVVRAGLDGLPWGHCQEWAAAGLITPRAAHQDPAAADPRWARLPPAAARWATAGFSPAETTESMALPDGHPGRPGDDQLAVMTSLRCPD